uniref:Uncharacterized protein n=1 Tax=Anguilla anguilla TaxID=7936 RepID=A0A0E9XHV6_ANGAN
MCVITLPLFSLRKASGPFLS